MGGSGSRFLGMLDNMLGGKSSKRPSGVHRRGESKVRKADAVEVLVCIYHTVRVMIVTRGTWLNVHTGGGGPYYDEH